MPSRDPKGQTRDPNMLRAQYLDNNRYLLLVRSAILATGWLLVTYCSAESAIEERRVCKGHRSANEFRTLRRIGENKKQTDNEKGREKKPCEWVISVCFECFQCDAGTEWFDISLYGARKIYFFRGSQVRKVRGFRCKWLRIRRSRLLHRCQSPQSMSSLVV